MAKPALTGVWMRYQRGINMDVSNILLRPLFIGIDKLCGLGLI